MGPVADEALRCLACGDEPFRGGRNDFIIVTMGGFNRESAGVYVGALKTSFTINRAYPRNRTPWPTARWEWPRYGRCEPRSANGPMKLQRLLQETEEQFNLPAPLVEIGDLMNANRVLRTVQ
jgi:hypothetical protein